METQAQYSKDYLGYFREASVLTPVANVEIDFARNI